MLKRKKNIRSKNNINDVNLFHALKSNGHIMDNVKAYTKLVKCKHFYNN